MSGKFFLQIILLTAGIWKPCKNDKKVNKLHSSVIWLQTYFIKKGACELFFTGHPLTFSTLFWNFLYRLLISPELLINRYYQIFRHNIKPYNWQASDISKIRGKFFNNPKNSSWDLRSFAPNGYLGYNLENACLYSSVTFLKNHCNQQNVKFEKLVKTCFFFFNKQYKAWIIIITAQSL